ncbi:MAG: RHS repeat-associated core domain-containing protein [Thermoguttaceae bacterium]
MTSTPLNQAHYQYVWSARGVDIPILRDAYTYNGNQVTDNRIYYLTDANGNVTALVNTSGAVVERYSYSAYGKVTIYDASWNVQQENGQPVSNYQNDRLFAGREYDYATGLYYNRARWYSPNTGEFITRDPTGYAAGDANLYRYCGNNPLSYTDPTGLHASGGSGGGQSGGSGNVQRVAEMRIALAVDRLGHRFQRAVEHLGDQHDRDAKQQQTPLAQIDPQHGGSDDYRGRCKEMDDEGTLPAHPRLQPAKSVAKLVGPGAAGRSTVILHPHPSSLIPHHSSFIPPHSSPNAPAGGICAPAMLPSRFFGKKRGSIARPTPTLSRAGSTVKTKLISSDSPIRVRLKFCE